MKTQQNQLAWRLEENGWRIVSRESGPDRWADEVWTIESVWRPTGRKLWITFLVAPPSDDDGNDAGVSAVTVTSRPPAEVQWPDVNWDKLPVRHTWADSLEKLIDRVGELRNQPASDDEAALPRAPRSADSRLSAVARLKTKHAYHDAAVRSVEFDPAGRVGLEIQLCGCSDAPGATVHLVFEGVRNVEEVRQVFSSAKRMRPGKGCVAEIVGIGRDESGLFVLDLAEATVRVKAKGFCET
jgi:hypothetical protein